MYNDPLRTDLCGVTLQNPVIAASGTFGFGAEYAEHMEASRLGGISGKGLTLEGSAGNPGIRIWETPSGMLNSIGLENPGVRHFIKEECPAMRRLGPTVLCNLGGHSERDYLVGAELLNEADIDILELNISCPNLKEGGMSFGVRPDTAGALVERVKRITRHPLLVKLTPQAQDIAAVAQAVQEAGADGISLINTVLGMAVDVENRRAVFANVYAGLSGPAILPIALRMVHQVCRAVSVPVVGMGGIACARDALAFIMAGATAVQVGCATFARPETALDVIDGLRAYCEANALGNIAEIRGVIG